MSREEKSDAMPKYAVARDIPQVTLDEVKNQARIMMKYGQKRGCITLVGESGVGKTQCVKQLGKELGARVIFVHTAHYGLMGAGIPQKAVDDYFKVAVPDIFPKPNEKAIVVFDELNRGEKHAINMFFTMLEDGRMFSYELPDECIVMATMNPATAQYTVTAIENEAAIRRRIKFFYVIPDLKGFLAHAESENFHLFAGRGPAQGQPCHPGILGYFKAKPKNIYDYKAKDANKQYCCPAVIETLSEDAYNLEAEKVSTYGEFALQRYAASMGMTMAQELVQHLRDSSLTIGAEDVLKSFKKIEPAVRKMINDSTMREALIDLNQNVVQLLFATTPSVKKIAKNFLDFVKIQPENLSQLIFQQMSPVAESNKARPYLHALSKELMRYEEWADLQSKIDENYREASSKIKG